MSLHAIKYHSICFVLLILAVLIGNAPAHAAVEEVPITVIIPSYNNEKWVQKNLSSLFEQQYTNYRVIYIDDCSSDNTSDLVKAEVEKYDQANRFTHIINADNRGAMRNLYDAIHSCDDDEIIVTYDGDDWFPNEHVLQTVNETYQKGNIWLTYGTFISHPKGIISYLSKPYPRKVIKENRFREVRRHPSHLRTFYAWLFKKIHKEDLLWNGEFFPMAWDLAMMFPMIEMAGERHLCIRKLTYVYNEENPISDGKKNAQFQLELDSYIRKLPPYARLKNRDAAPEYDLRKLSKNS